MATHHRSISDVLRTKWTSGQFRVSSNKVWVVGQRRHPRAPSPACCANESAFRCLRKRSALLCGFMSWALYRQQILAQRVGWPLAARPRGAPLDHRQDHPPLKRPARQLAPRRVHALEERRLRLLERGRLTTQASRAATAPGRSVWGATGSGSTSRTSQSVSSGTGCTMRTATGSRRRTTSLVSRSPNPTRRRSRRRTRSVPWTRRRGG